MFVGFAFALAVVEVEEQSQSTIESGVNIDSRISVFCLGESRGLSFLLFTI